MPLNNLIYITGGTRQQIKQALQDWIGMYAETLPTGFHFDLYKTAADSYCIKAKPDLENDGFFYLVNYLFYPIDINYQVEVIGYTTGEENFPFQGQQLFVFLASHDDEADNVYVTTAENATYKVSFGEQAIKPISPATPYQPPVQLTLEHPERITTTANKTREKPAFVEDELDDLERRFKLFYYLFFGIFIASPLMLFFDPIYFKHAFSVAGIGLGTWLLVDYKILRQSVYFFLCLFFAAFYCFLWIKAKDSFYLSDEYWINAASYFPLCVLSLQWSLRRIYLSLLNKEPVFDRHGTFPELVYTLLLMFGSILLPFWLVDIMG